MGQCIEICLSGKLYLMNACWESQRNDSYTEVMTGHFWDVSQIHFRIDEQDMLASNLV